MILARLHQTAVTRYGGIAGEKGNPFNEGLRHQNSIKQIGEFAGHVVDGRGMPARYGELAVTVIKKGTPKEPRVQPKIGAAQRGLGGDLPYVRGTEEGFVFETLDYFPHLLREPLRFGSRPQKQLRIEQQPHRDSRSGETHGMALKSAGRMS